jgi:type IV secretion system protein VirB10
MDAEAIKSQPVVDGFGDIGIAAAGGGTQPLLAGIQQQRGTGSNPQIPTALAALAQQLGGGDPNRQDQKEDFLRNTGATLTHQGYSGNMPLPQQFDLELKAGTVIPGMLVTGVNSDLPGPVMGQVSENVWDSTHGRYVLIPKGTRVLGVYDSQIVYGQKRVLVVWNRLVFPNGTTLNIAGSAGLDQSGYSGLTGKVNEHWDRMIKTALLATLFVTGAEMISPRENRLFSNNQAKSPGEIASEQAANSILDMSSKLMNKNMDIQPTITIRPGRRFNIFVEKDIVFPDPYPIEFK